MTQITFLSPLYKYRPINRLRDDLIHEVGVDVRTADGDAELGETVTPAVQLPDEAAVETITVVHVLSAHDDVVSG